MRKKDVEIGGKYFARVSGLTVTIRIDNVSPYGGWLGTNLSTGRRIRIRTAARLQDPARKYLDARRTS